MAVSTAIAARYTIAAGALPRYPYGANDSVTEDCTASAGLMKRLFDLRYSDLSFYACAALIVAVHVWVVLLAGTSFPTPWPDEAHFLWQARAFATDFSLFAPELNTERMILWMPPGYLVVVGILFKIVGPSLEAARSLSLALMIPAMVMLLIFLSNRTSRGWSLVFWGLFILNARFIACANIARMEALLLLIVTGAFLLMQRQCLTWGLLVLFFAPLVHFNGFLFVAGGLGYAIYQYRSKAVALEWNRKILGVTILLAAVWIGYAMLALWNWDAFAHDMAFQFERKGNAGPWSFLTTHENLLVLIVLVLATAYAVRYRLPSVELAFLAIPAWLTWRIGHELWYEVLYHVGFLTGSLLLLDVWNHLVASNTTGLTRVRRYTAVGLFAILVVAWNYRLGNIEDMMRYPWSLDLQTMDYTISVPYMTDQEKEDLAGQITAISRGQNVKVLFEPAADAFLVLPYLDERVEHTYPLFQEQKPDICVVHYSRHLPAWWKFNEHILARAGVSRDSTAYIIKQRNDTEQWFVVPVAPALKSAP